MRREYWSQAMPVVARLDWVARQLAMGRRAHIAIGEAKDCKKVKVTITMEAATSGSITPVVLSSLNMTLSMVRMLALSGICTDRGHRHSSGRSVICIWISVSTSNGASASENAGEVPALPVETKAGGDEGIQQNLQASGEDVTQINDNWKSLPASGWQRIYARFGYVEEVCVCEPLEGNFNDSVDVWTFVTPSNQHSSDLLDPAQHIILHKELTEDTRQLILAQGGDVYIKLLANTTAKAMNRNMQKYSQEFRDLGPTKTTQALKEILPTAILDVYTETLEAAKAATNGDLALLRDPLLM